MSGGYGGGAYNQNKASTSGSWRDESTFKKQSAMSDEEKLFLKHAKKIRDILKLEEKQKGGEKLDAKQQEKLDTLPASVKEIAAVATKLPGNSEVLEKNPDVVALLPQGTVQQAYKAKEQAQVRAKQEEKRREWREEKERQERDRVEHQTRHDRPITCIATSPDGNYIYTSSKDKVILCWSTSDALLVAVRTLGGHGGAVWCVDVGEKVVSGGADGKVMLWPADVRGNRPAVVSPSGEVNHGGIVKVARWCPFDSKKFATASEKLGSTAPFVAVWQLKGSGAEQTLKLTDLPTKANDVQWGGGAKTKLFTSHDNGYVGVWDADIGKLLKTIKVHTGSVSCLCLAPDGKTLFTSSHDKTAAAVDVSTPQTPILKTWEADRPLNAVGVSADFSRGEDGSPETGAVVVGGGRDPREVTTSNLLKDEFEAYIFSSKGEWWGSGKGHFGPIHAIKFLPNSKQPGFATASEDGCLRVHDLYGNLLNSDVQGGREAIQ